MKMRRLILLFLLVAAFAALGMADCVSAPVREEISTGVSTTVYLKDLNDFVTMNAVYAGFFTAKPLARVTVEVSCLPRDVLVEISAIAAK